MGEPVGRIRARASRLRATEVRGELALRAIDEIPALAVAAAFAEGDTVFARPGRAAGEGIRPHRRGRARATRAGVTVEERPDGFVVSGLAGRPPAGGTVKPDHDHRIAMAGAILGLSSDAETTVPAADIATSFPSFSETLVALGATIADH